MFDLVFIDVLVGRTSKGKAKEIGEGKWKQVSTYFAYMVWTCSCHGKSK